MLIHDAFCQNLIIHTNEDNVNWVDYDQVYLHRMKRYLKRQLVEKFGDVKGMRFLIERPVVIRKQLPLMMAMWELGGILVVYDLHYILMKNPLYKDFNANIDCTLVEHNDQTLNNVIDNIVVMDGRILELKYFDLDPEFFNDELPSPIVATEDDVALVVYTSGSNRAPQQMPYTHKQVVAHARANIKHFDYRADEHVYHYKSFHHGGMCVNYLLPTLMISENHYFKIQHGMISVGDYIGQMLTEVPVNRLLFTFELSDNLIDNLSFKKSMAEHLTIICTHWIKDEKQMDRLFSTGQVSRFISPFGCRELLSCLMQHDITPETWANRGPSWDPTIFERVQDDFWEYKLIDGEMAVRAPWQTDFYAPGDRVEHVEGRRWRWTGRNTQIKREGLVVMPDAVDGVLKSYHPEFVPLVVADYQHKKLYCLVLHNPANQTASELLTLFNDTIRKQIDHNHLLDLVIYSATSTDLLEKQHFGGRLDPSLSVLRYMARQQLGLDPTL